MKLKDLVILVKKVNGRLKGTCGFTAAYTIPRPESLHHLLCGYGLVRTALAIGAAGKRRISCELLHTSGSALGRWGRIPHGCCIAMKYCRQAIVS